MSSFPVSFVIFPLLTLHMPDFVNIKHNCIKAKCVHPMTVSSRQVDQITWSVLTIRLSLSLLTTTIRSKIISLVTFVCLAMYGQQCMVNKVSKRSRPFLRRCNTSSGDNIYCCCCSWVLRLTNLKRLFLPGSAVFFSCSLLMITWRCFFLFSRKVSIVQASVFYTLRVDRRSNNSINNYNNNEKAYWLKHKFKMAITSYTNGNFFLKSHVAPFIQFQN